MPAGPAFVPVEGTSAAPSALSLTGVEQGTYASYLSQGSHGAVGPPIPASAGAVQGPTAISAEVTGPG